MVERAQHEFMRIEYYSVVHSIKRDNPPILRYHKIVKREGQLINNQREKGELKG
jgi:hypothetical protein